MSLNPLFCGKQHASGFIKPITLIHDPFAIIASLYVALSIRAMLFLAKVIVMSYRRSAVYKFDDVNKSLILWKTTC